MGMVGARELLPAEAPALAGGRRTRSPARAGVIRPRLYLIPDGYPRMLSAGRGARGRRGARGLARACSASRRPPSSRDSSPTSSPTCATATSSSRPSPRSSPRRSSTPRESAATSSAPPLRARADRGVVRAPRALAEPRVRGRPLSPPSSAARRTDSPTGCSGSSSRWGSSPSRRAPRPSRSTRPNPFAEEGLAALFRDASAARRARPRLRALDPEWREKLRAALTDRNRAPCGALKKMGGVLLSREIALRVPSALAGLTSLFGMGRGVSPPL